MTSFGVITNGGEYDGCGDYVPHLWENTEPVIEGTFCKTYVLTCENIEQFPELTRDGYETGDNITICEFNGQIAPLWRE